MATFVETFDIYKSEMSNLGIDYDEALFFTVTKSIGPIIYNADSSRVSCTDSDELSRIKNNFLIGKLGLADSPDLNAVIQETCERLGAANRNKFRAIFYYLLVVRFGKESAFK
jgi:hypothetical protein